MGIGLTINISFVDMQLGCSIPLANNPDKIIIPKRRTPEKFVENLSYIVEDEPVDNGSQASPLFGGHQSWLQREQSFKLNSTMKVQKILLWLIILYLFKYRIFGSSKAF